MPKTPDRIIRNLWSVFTTFFSLKDIEKEISGEVKIALCGDSPKAEELKNLLGGMDPVVDEEEKVETQEVLRLTQYPPDEEDISFMQKCDIAVMILAEKTLNIELIREISKKIEAEGKPRDEQKILWFLDGEPKEMRRDEVKDIFEDAGIEEIHWIESEWAELPRLILEYVKENGLAYAEKFSILRAEMTKKIVNKTASENAYISFFSSLPQNLPIIGPIIGFIAVAGETLFITANQIRMCLRIAGIYGYKVDFFSRMSELWPVLAGAFGWRTLARGLIGFIPGGGPIIKTSIAYAGTKVVGETARWYYRDGKKLNQEEMKEIYLKEKSNVLDNFDGFLQKLKQTEAGDNVDLEQPETEQCREQKPPEAGKKGEE